MYGWINLSNRLEREWAAVQEDTIRSRPRQENGGHGQIIQNFFRMLFQIWKHGNYCQKYYHTHATD